MAALQVADYDDGPVMPHNAEAEMCVIGCMVISPKACDAVLARLTAKSFYVPAHQVVFDAVKALRKENMAVDLVTLRDGLARVGKLGEAGGVDYLVQAVESVPTAQNTLHYTGIVQDMARRRSVIHRAQALVKAAYSMQGPDGPLHVRDLVMQAGQINRGLVEDQGATKELHELDFRTVSKGFRFGFPSVEKTQQCKGLPCGQLTVVRAGTKIGKSSLMAQVALDWYEQGHRVMYVLLTDLDHDLFAKRVAKHLTGYADAPQGNLADLEEWERQIGAIEGTKDDQFPNEGRLLVHDCRKAGPGGKRISHVCQTVKEAYDEGKADRFFIDYFQVIRPDSGGTDYSGYQQIAERLDDLVSSMPDAVVVVGSQVTVDKDGKSRARYSPEVEFNAGIVLQVHRDVEEENKSKERWHESQMEVVLSRFGGWGFKRACWYDRKRLRFIDKAHGKPEGMD